MIAGIDFSSFQADIVLLSEDDDTATHHVFRFGKGDAFDRARTIRGSMPSRDWWTDQGVIAIGIEDPRGMSTTAIAVLNRAMGGILACLPPTMFVHPWKPAEWRSELGISNVGKEAPRDFAWMHWAGVPLPAVVAKSQDSLDAYCLAYATRQRVVIEEAA